MFSIGRWSYCARRNGFRMRPQWAAILIAGSLLVPAAVCLGAVIDKVNVTRTGNTNTATVNGSTGVLASVSSPVGTVAESGSCHLVEAGAIDHWSCTPSVALPFDLISITVARAPELDSMLSQFVCGPMVEPALASLLYLDVKEDPNFPHHQVIWTEFTPACDDKIDVYLQVIPGPEDPPITDVYFDHAAPDCSATLTAGVVLHKYHTIDTLEATLDGKPVQVDPVSQTQQKLLADALQNAELYDDEQQDLWFWKFTPLAPCEDPFQLVVRYRELDHSEQPVLSDSLVAGFTTQADLDEAEGNEEPLAYLEPVNTAIIEVGIPTASAWGLLVLALLLLVGAKAYFASRKGIQKVE